MNRVEGILGELADALAQAKLASALVGGHAVNAWLEPRFTADIDLTIEADPNAVRKVQRVLEQRGWMVEREYGANLPSGPDFIRFARGPNESVIELQVAKTDYQREVIRRAVAGSAGFAVPVATIEDLIVLKLIAHRHKDRLDLLGLAALPKVDWSYVKRWAAEWDVTDRLTALLNEMRN